MWKYENLKVWGMKCEMWKCWIWQKQIEGGLDGVKGNERWFSVRGFSAPGKCPTRKITGLEREAHAVIIIIEVTKTNSIISFLIFITQSITWLHFGTNLFLFVFFLLRTTGLIQANVIISVSCCIKVMLVTKRSIHFCKFYDNNYDTFFLSTYSFNSR